MFEGVIDSMIESAKASNLINEGDYIDEEGLYCCGKCHTRKQARYNVLGREITPMIPCKCREEELKKEEEQEKQLFRDRRILHLLNCNS